VGRNVVSSEYFVIENKNSLGKKRYKNEYSSYGIKLNLFGWV
jgi:hypothetical protein